METSTMSAHGSSKTSRIVALAAGAIVGAGAAQARGVQPGSPAAPAVAGGRAAAAVAKGGFAVVDATGKLVRGRNAVSARLIFPGLYAVIFDSNIRSCAYIATLADPGSVNPGPVGQIGTVGLTTSVRGVFVETFDSTGVDSSLPFHLHVVC
jgi:hypothetical protein